MRSGGLLDFLETLVRKYLPDKLGGFKHARADIEARFQQPKEVREEGRRRKSASKEERKKNEGDPDWDRVDEAEELISDGSDEGPRGAAREEDEYVKACDGVDVGEDEQTGEGGEDEEVCCEDETEALGPDPAVGGGEAVPVRDGPPDEGLDLIPFIVSNRAMRRILRELIKRCLQRLPTEVL